MGMQAFIAKIGKGPRESKDLTWEESKQAMRLLIEGQATPAQVGAFLLAMRLKVESVTELAAFTAAARDYVVPLRRPAESPLVDLPVYAGKEETFHASVGAALVAVAAGAVVLMHGAETLPERPGPSRLLAELGIATDLTPGQAGDALASGGFAYLDLALYHPPLARFLELKRELGVGSIVEPIAAMLNPARAAAQVIGLSHQPYLEKMAEALGMLGCRRALILRGVEGAPELSLSGPTRVLELSGGKTIPLVLQPKDVGMTGGHSQDMARRAQEGAWLRRLLENQVPGGARDWVLLNAALLLYASGRAPSISAAVPLATRALESGAAARKLAEVAGRRQPSTVHPS